MIQKNRLPKGRLILLYQGTEENSVKRIIAVALVFAALFSGCQSGAFSLEDGLYALEQAENGGAEVPYLIVRGERLDVIQAAAVSYQPSGTLNVSGSWAVMETSFGGEPYKITFRLIGDNMLKFVSAKSDIPCGEEIWRDGMIFALAKSEAESAVGSPRKTAD